MRLEPTGRRQSKYNGEKVFGSHDSRPFRGQIHKLVRSTNFPLVPQLRGSGRRTNEPANRRPLGITPQNGWYQSKGREPRLAAGRGAVLRRALGFHGKVSAVTVAWLWSIVRFFPK